MAHANPTTRLVYVLPRIRISSTTYGERVVTLDRAQFWRDEPPTWTDVLKLPRPEWLNIFRNFPPMGGREPPFAEGTILISDDDEWLRQHVSRVVGLCFVFGVEQNHWQLPADAFQYYGINATQQSHDLVTLHTKTSSKTESCRSITLLPPLELRGVGQEFRIDVHDDANEALIHRFMKNPNDRLIVACYHLFRSQFESPFISPPEQDYAAMCACLEAALDIKGPDYGKETGDRIQALFPWFPDIARWIKGLYSERSVFNHGATVDELEAAKDDRLKALFEFRTRKLNWDALRHLCLEVIRSQLEPPTEASNQDIARLYSPLVRVLRKLFDSDELWKAIVKTFTKKESVKKLLAMSGDPLDDFLELCCAYLNGHHWGVIRHDVQEKQVFAVLKAMAAVIGETSDEQADKAAADDLYKAAGQQDAHAVDAWAMQHAMWKRLPAWQELNLAAKAVAVQTAEFFEK